MGSIYVTGSVDFYLGRNRLSGESDIRGSVDLDIEF